jgi:c-di-GMP-binding flagellar brake protein YcgR
VHLPDLRRELRPLLVDISETGARFRTPFKLPQHTRVAFTWLGPSKERIPITGHVVAAHKTESRAIDYGVVFSMPAADKDRLARDLAEMQRRRAFRAGREGGPKRDPQPRSDGRERRRGYRASLRFPVHVRARKEGRSLSVRADAHDVSTGGMLVALPGAYDDGTELQVTFTLPLHVVDHGGDETVTVEQTPFGPRRVKKTLPVRPFEQIEAKAHIVHKRGAESSPLYGVTFADFSPFLQEEIARFVHAYQLTQLRKSAAQAE